jgi:hypothetical protein
MSSTEAPHIEKFSRVIQNIKYIKECKKTNKKDIHSICYLLDERISRQLTQSDCIKLGFGLEYLFLEIIIQNAPHLKNITPLTTTKGKKQLDHLFEDAEKKIIYYAELKSNLHLDTEKSRATAEKCLKIYNELCDTYPDYTVKMFLVGNRYLETTDLQKYNIITNRYTIIKNNLCGVNDYFRELGLPQMCFVDAIQYAAVLHFLIKEMFGYSPTPTSSL